MGHRAEQRRCLAHGDPVLFRDPVRGLPTAFNDQLTQLHPFRGVRTPPVPKQMRAIITPIQFTEIYSHLPKDAARLLVETDIETGLLWGELTELRSSTSTTSAAC